VFTQTVTLTQFYVFLHVFDKKLPIMKVWSEHLKGFEKEHEFWLHPLMLLLMRLDAFW
jgi:hypothetical protein